MQQNSPGRCRRRAGRSVAAERLINDTDDVLNDHLQSTNLNLDPADMQRLANLCGQLDEHLRQIERYLGVEINNRGSHFRILGDARPMAAASRVLQRLYAETEHSMLTPEQVQLSLQEESINDGSGQPDEELVIRRVRGQNIKGRSESQRRYIKGILHDDVHFGIGPAGTGKTYLAVACAVEALEREQVRRIVLVRPAVEAGERLGFLPGDLTQKIDPYLRPLYDALYEMLGFEKVSKLIERNVIEVAPLAYMRGRTLNDSFIILDEAQNSTVEQMKMFLTRTGFGSTVVVTGDITQIDLPRGKISGLRHIVDVLRNIEGVGFTFFQAADVVRHPLVQRIVEAYEGFEQDEAGAGSKDGA